MVICQPCKRKLFPAHTHTIPPVYGVVTTMSYLSCHLFADYEKLDGMIGLPSCSEKTWQKIIEGLEVHVGNLAEWSCNQVRETIK